MCTSRYCNSELEDVIINIEFTSIPGPFRAKCIDILYKTDVNVSEKKLEPKVY